MILDREPRDDRWAALAAALGLRAHLVCAPYREGDGYRQLRSRVGMPAPEPGLGDWICGAYDGAGAIIASYQQAATLGDLGANTRGGLARFTAVLVELDPPLFMGAHVTAEGRLRELVGGSDVEIGVPEVDGALRLGALDTHKLRALLAPADPADLPFLQRLAGFARGGLFVTDWAVGFRLPGASYDPAHVGSCLQSAAWVRRELLARLPRVPRRDHEAALAAEWTEYAAAAGLTFDAARFSVQGVVDGIALEIALAPRAGAPLTCVMARWPRPIGVQLRVAKFGQNERDPELARGGHRFFAQFFTNLLGQDIRVGDAPFDDAFQVQGFPEQQVRAVLTSPDLRAAMVQIASVSDEVAMTDQAITWFLAGPARGADLGRHVAMAAHTAKALYPGVQGAHPFR